MKALRIATFVFQLLVFNQIEGALKNILNKNSLF